MLPTSPWYSDQKQKRRRSMRQEDTVAADTGGRRQKASGALRFRRGDVSTPDFLVECKRTESRSMSLKWEWLEKISTEAYSTEKIPALAIEFGDETAIKTRDARGRLRLPTSRQWTAVPSRIFAEMLEAYRERQEAK